MTTNKSSPPTSDNSSNNSNNNNNSFAVYEPFAKQACDFFTASPDPFHAVQRSIDLLQAAGFEALRPREPFVGKLHPHGKYYYHVNHTTLVAFTVGGNLRPDVPWGIKAIGGHTDSPNLRLKPISKLDHTASAVIQLGVECYGGGLWHTWLDRDLGLSGRVLIRPTTPSISDDGGATTTHTTTRVEQHLVNFPEPLARISSLCIHLQSQEERRALVLNHEEHLRPIIATSSSSILIPPPSPQDILEQGAERLLAGRHSPLVLEKIAQQLQISVDQILDVELNLYDVQPATLGGMQSEFLYSARLDNLATCFVAIQALVAHAANDDGSLLADDTDVSLVALFDHEEVGSGMLHNAMMCLFV